jgi:hypothetical protein
MSLPLTTLFHLGPLWVPHECFQSSLDPYPKIVMAATTISFLWHLTGEKVRILTALNYTCAFLWAVLDILYAYTFHDLETIVQVLYLNLVVAIIHRAHEFIKTDRECYVYNHSLWHLLSTTKCLAVALLLRCQ